MNKGFSESIFEFQRIHVVRDKTVGAFLAKFCAIFTLNQDLLLERHYQYSGQHPYCEHSSFQGKYDVDILGMELTTPNETDVLKCEWQPKSKDKFKVSSCHQPYFKLHGSSNWKDNQRKMLIMGGNKEGAIESHEVLKWYYEQFKEYLKKPDTRLMVIGYSFNDEHINNALIEAAKDNQLKLFVIDPAGTEVISKCNNELEKAIIGASRRPMSEIFGSNTSIEYDKVMKFFS